MKIIGWITTFIITAFLSALWSGYVLSILWRWFVVPVFAAPELTIGYAIGLRIIVSYTAWSVTTPPSESEKTFAEKMLAAIGEAATKPAIALLFGWVTKVCIEA